VQFLELPDGLLRFGDRVGVRLLGIMGRTTGSP
jgi:hypothetical protein